MADWKINRLISKIENTKNINKIISILERDDIDLSVLEAAYKRSNVFEQNDKEEIFNRIFHNKHVSSDLVNLIVNQTKDSLLIRYIIDSSYSRFYIPLLESIVNWIIANDEPYVLGYLLLYREKNLSFDLLLKIVSYAKNIYNIRRILFGAKMNEKLLYSIFEQNINNEEVLDLILEGINNIGKSSYPVITTTVDGVSMISDKFLLDLKTKIEKIKGINQDDIIEKKDNVINDEKIVLVQNNEKFDIEYEDNVTERLRRNVEDGMSTMMWGLSGIGKTARVSEVDPDYTMIKLKNDMLPEEVTGGKEPNGLPGEVYPPKWYVKLCEKCEREPDKMHILFIDELTNVKNNVKSLVWEIIEDRRVNGDEDWKLPDNCAIVAAGNRPEESTSVINDYNGGVLPEPLHDRFDFHIEIPLDMKEWQKWALETDKKTGNLNIHPSVLSFCVGQGEKIMFSSLDVNDATKPRLSPRRWAKLSKAIYMAEKRGGKSCHVSNQRIAECIGSEIAPAFIAYYEKEPIDMKKVENGDYNPEDFKNIDDKLFALSSVLGEYNGSELAIEDFIVTCLGEDYLSIYKVMKKQRDEVVFDDKKDNGLNIEIVKSGMKKIC